MSSVAPFLPKHPAGYASHILQQMAEQKQNSQFTDFIISCQGQEIHCHKNVLAATCPYFSHMFSSGLKEVQEARAVMDNIEVPIMKSIVQFLYGQCPSIDWNQVECLLEACELLQLNELKKQLEDSVADKITQENCIHWWKVADKYNLEKAGAMAKSHMILKFEEVSKSHDFMKLTYGELVDYLRNDAVVLSHQDQVLYAGIRWVSADTDERKPLMLEILKLAKLGECSSGTVNDVTNSHNDLFTEPDVMRFVYSEVLSRLASRPGILVLGGMSAYIGTCYTECRRSFGRLPNITWELFTNIPKSAVGERPSYVSLLGGFAVMCGGKSGRNNARYDLKKNDWTDLPPTPEKLTNTVALHADGKIHVLDGGVYSDSIPVLTDGMFTLSLETLKWSKGPKLLDYQYHPVAAAYDQSLWVILNDCVITKGPRSLLPGANNCTLQLLSPGANNWVYRSNLPDGMRTQGACVVGFKTHLYLLPSNNQCARYSIVTDQWTKMTSKPSVSHFFGSVFVLGQKILLCGGGSKSDTNDCIEEYDPESDQWTTWSCKLPKPLTLFTASS